MKDPIVEKAQGFLDEGDKQFDVHSSTIDAVRKHLLLQSDHLDARAGIESRSAFYLPQITPAARARAATIFDVFTSGAPSIRLTPTNSDLPGAVEAVANVESYVNECFDVKKLWLVWNSVFFNAEIYPIAACYQRWDESHEEIQAIDKMGGLSSEEMITYSGPALDGLNPDTYRTELYARQKDQIRYHFITKEVSRDYILGRKRQGRYNLLDPSELKSAAAGTWFTQRCKNKRYNDSYTKPESLAYEMVIGFVYDELNGFWEEIIFIGDALLSRRRIPKTPPVYMISSFPLPGEIAGLSTAMLGMAGQNVVNEFINQAIEANEQAIWSPVLYKGRVTSNPVWEPMALWQVDDPDSFRKLNEPRGVMDYLAFIRLIEERSQSTQAAYDTVQPVSGGSKQTAREYLGKKASYDKVMSVNLQSYAAEIVQSIRDMISMARENMSGWVNIGLIDPNGPGGNLKPNDLFYDAKIELPNIKMLSDEPMEMAKWDSMYQVLMANPLVTSNPAAVYEVTKRYLYAHKEKTLEKIIGKEPVMPQVGMM